MDMMFSLRVVFFTLFVVVVVPVMIGLFRDYFGPPVPDRPLYGPESAKPSDDDEQSKGGDSSRTDVR